MLAQVGDVCQIEAPEGRGAFCDDPVDPGSGTSDNRVIDILNTVVDVLSFAVGVIAVITIIIGGIQYTTAGGDGASTSKARNTIIYSVVAIVTTVLARSIIVFVLDRI